MGIKKQNRHHVHLSKDTDTALAVAKRHGKPVILEILAKQMVDEWFEFFESDNGVWLTEEVPVRFIRVSE